MRLQADETLGKFMDYCTYGHMIDNVVLLVTGTLHERDVQVRRGDGNNIEMRQQLDPMPNSVVRDSTGAAGQVPPAGHV